MIHFSLLVTIYISLLLSISFNNRKVNAMPTTIITQQDENNPELRCPMHGEDPTRSTEECCDPSVLPGVIYDEEDDACYSTEYENMFGLYQWHFSSCCVSN
ncbi:hypothetical protein BDC45DRAFT_522170 [Circinella umbellata]|nr:hypothetical protein BDC45DRAFT_522170 [Circinella umbellata]